ncbi:ABC transporter substrate-binding protein [Nocardiopsis sp. NPDC006832]|uniref:ABC transporter substrate-binding protein n=1 Tax=Nocardiopsis sp. NPDC006832 TaxID=3157188 RepID=UPI0033DC616A
MRSLRVPLVPLMSLLTVGSLALSACGAGESTTEAEEATGSETRVVETGQGEVSVPGAPERVVVLNHALAGYLYHLDVPVVGVIPETADTEGAFSEHWAQAAEEDGTEILPWSADGFDLEAILGLEPDLIIAGGLGFPHFQAVEAYDRLGEIAPTVIVDDTRTTWQDQFSFLAEEVFESPERYEELAATYDERVEEVAAAITVPPNPATFLTVTADQTPYVLIEDMGLPETFARLGFETDTLFTENDFEPYTAGGDMFEISSEQVGRIVDAPTVFIIGFHGDTADVESLSESSVYAALPAFEEGNAYDLPHWGLRGDYDEELALLDIVEEQFS